MAPIFTRKPKPAAKPGFFVVECTKCYGTGGFCLYVENGRPMSNTGLTCYGCNGAGWKQLKSKFHSKTPADPEPAAAKPVGGTRAVCSNTLTNPATSPTAGMTGAEEDVYWGNKFGEAEAEQEAAAFMNDPDLFWAQARH